MFYVDSILENGLKYEIPNGITRGEAIESIQEGELIFEDISDKNFPRVFINDTLLAAKRIFNQVEYAEILRGEVVVFSNEKMEAENV